MQGLESSAPFKINIDVLMTQKEPYTNKTDCWSLGITILELIEGKAPKEKMTSRITGLICYPRPST